MLLKVAPSNFRRLHLLPTSVIAAFTTAGAMKSGFESKQFKMENKPNRLTINSGKSLSWAGTVPWSQPLPFWKRIEVQMGKKRFHLPTSPPLPYNRLILPPALTEEDRLGLIPKPVDIPRGKKCILLSFGFFFRLFSTESQFFMSRKFKTVRCDT